MEKSKSRVSEPAYPFRHSVDLQMRFSDIDMLGHLNNNVYLQFMDLGKSRYFMSVMPGGVDFKHINVVVVNISCDFHAPTYLSEPIAVLTQVTFISEHSFSMEQRIVNTATGEVKCVGRTVMAGFDPATATSAPIDPAWVAALEAYEGRFLRKL